MGFSSHVAIMYESLYTFGLLELTGGDVVQLTAVVGKCSRVRCVPADQCYQSTASITHRHVSSSSSRCHILYSCI